MQQLEVVFSDFVFFKYKIGKNIQFYSFAKLRGFERLYMLQFDCMLGEVIILKLQKRDKF
jgi:hypothetical protein